MSELDERESIRELHARYALASDKGHAPQWVACFTEDGVFAGEAFGEHTGRKALEDFSRAMNESLDGAQIRHVITNISISLDGDTATGSAYLLYYLTKDGNTQLSGIGGYNDVMRKVGGSWLFERRDVFFD